MGSYYKLRQFIDLWQQLIQEQFSAILNLDYSYL